MKKTGGEIEQYFYEIVKNSIVKTTISGSLYRAGLRPINANTEDAVVSFVAGLDEEIQTGVLNLNVYVPNITSNKASVIDITRCTEIEVILNAFVESLSISGDYVFKKDKTIQTFPVEGIEQHFVNCRIKFKLSTI